MRRSRTDDELAQMWGEWIAGMGEWHVFGGLTYDPGRRRVADGLPVRPGADVVRSHARKWLREAKAEAAVVAVEYHKNGWPHMHPLVRLAGGGYGHELADLGQLWFKAHGYARLEVPRDQADVAAYAAKYLSKDLARGDVIFWPPTGPLTTHQHGLAVSP